MALELLDDHPAALTVADQAVRELSEVHDAVNAGDVALKRAWVLIRSGTRAEEGYRELARLMNAYGVHAHWVAVDPLWLIVRDDARVQQILRDAFPRP